MTEQKDVWSGVALPLRCYIGRCKSEEMLKLSASGGVFFSLAASIVERGGVVYGAKYSGDKVVHSRADSIEQVIPLLGSKYVQSEIGQTYEAVLTDLKNKTTVLFSGTPCQVVGLLSYLKARKSQCQLLEHLITVDVVCHGVGSPAVFKSYISEVCQSGFLVKNINMRSKRFGYRSGGIELQKRDGRTKYASISKDAYLNAFFSGAILRKCCYLCKFKTARHQSDLTLWDSWHAEETLGVEPDNRGYTNIAVQSNKGERILAAASDYLNLYSVSFKEIRPSTGGMLLFSTPYNPIREDFLAEVRKRGISYARARFYPWTIKDEIKELVKQILRRVGLLDIVVRKRDKARKKRW